MQEIFLHVKHTVHSQLSMCGLITKFLEPLQLLITTSHNDLSAAHYICFSNMYQ
jgi:hypothetical protein